jgi:hypothetical protein
MNYLSSRKDYKLCALIHIQLGTSICLQKYKLCRYAAKLMTSSSFLQFKWHCNPSCSKNCKMQVQQANVWCCIYCFRRICDTYHPESCKPVNPSLMCSILFWHVKLHSCKILVYIQPSMLRNQLCSSCSQMWMKEERKAKNAKTKKERNFMVSKCITYTVIK